MLQSNLVENNNQINIDEQNENEINEIEKKINFIKFETQFHLQDNKINRNNISNIISI